MTAAGKITIRPCRAADLDRVVRLLSDDVLGAGRETQDGNLQSYRDAFSDIEADPRNTVYVAERDGCMLGCYQLTIIPNLTFKGALRAQVEGVRVAEEARGQGIGERMMAHAVELARAENCKIVQLTSNTRRPAAIRFYERIGFQPTHVGFKLYL